MISVCDDILLEDMESQDFMDTFIDQSFHEAIDTLFGYDGENNYTYDSKHKKLAELHDGTDSGNPAQPDPGGTQTRRNH